MIKSGFQNLVEVITVLKWKINPGIAIGQISFENIFKASEISILYSGFIAIILYINERILICGILDKISSILNKFLFPFL